MSLQICPECGAKLTQEMIDVNMCWECGKILNDAEFGSEPEMDPELLKMAQDQAREIDPWSDKRYAQHKLTTCNSFPQFKILEYKGLVSGEAIIGTGLVADAKAALADAFGVVSNAYSKKMKLAKEKAILDMIGESVDKGGNAIIGIAFNYITFAGSNMIGVSVVGTSVAVESI